MFILAVAGILLIFYPPTDVIPKLKQIISDSYDRTRVSVPNFGSREVSVVSLGMTLRATSNRDGQAYPSCAPPRQCLYVMGIGVSSPLRGFRVDDIIVAVNDPSNCRKTGGGQAEIRNAPDAAKETFPVTPVRDSVARLIGIAQGNPLRNRVCATVIRSDKIVEVSVSRKPSRPSPRD